jgi:hypothetical protein
LTKSLIAEIIGTVYIFNFMKGYLLVTKISKPNGIVDKIEAQSKFENDCNTLCRLGFKLETDDLDGTNIKEKDTEFKICCRIVSFPAETYLLRNDDLGLMMLIRSDENFNHTPLIRFKSKGYALRIAQVYSAQ